MYVFIGRRKYATYAHQTEALLSQRSVVIVARCSGSSHTEFVAGGGRLVFPLSSFFFFFFFRHRCEAPELATCSGPQAELVLRSIGIFIYLFIFSSSSSTIAVLFMKARVRVSEQSQC
jgi:hypothetical protein